MADPELITSPAGADFLLRRASGCSGLAINFAVPRFPPPTASHSPLSAVAAASSPPPTMFAALAQRIARPAVAAASHGAASCLPPQPAARLLLARSARAYSSQASSGNKGWDAVSNLANEVGKSIQGSTPLGYRVSPEDAWAAMSRSIVPELERQKPAGKYKGRTVRVQNRDLSEAFRQLRVILSRNRVPQTFHYQKRHERKGDRRRRLRSENWRKAFKNEVRKRVLIVNTIRRKGA
ncbi:hypothetical protein EV122DRAFT_270573 [Schizophyllum commune]